MSRRLHCSLCSSMARRHISSGPLPTQYTVQGVLSYFRICLHAHSGRHLAHKWSTTYIAPNAKRRLLPASETELGTIEHLILLDLLGAPNPTILSSFVDTAWLFDSMVAAEKRLAQSGAFVYGKEGVETKEKFTSFFTPREGIYGFGGIEDDHIPFLRLGVSVLHVIANPFPRVWHKLQVCGSDT